MHVINEAWEMYSLPLKSTEIFLYDYTFSTSNSFCVIHFTCSTQFY
ncbi:unnamed protein product [Cylicostephanus goldi]|uniref:Uncharacterized protein n=1 Tax=Cylicostephanus goldi TaxID=71465 RepID=A0A3P6RVG1_CYLGO|nr:unnamed protein product [Cylicostephanus goldi]